MDIGKLFDLQKLDLNLEKARRKLAQLKQALGESDELGSARKTVADTEAELHHWHAAQKNAELESQALAQQIDGKDKELMSGRVPTPKSWKRFRPMLRRCAASALLSRTPAWMHCCTWRH